MRNRLFFVAALIPLLASLAASSCVPGKETGVLTLKELPGGVNGPHVRDIGPHSAQIVFNTTTPVVCNVAYGTDARYGRISVMAMAGPVTAHELQLVGLEPNTTYHFRTTVTDLESKVYQSDDLTFTTTEAVQRAKPSGPNLAALARGAKVVGLSSNWGSGGLDGSFGGNRAIDGDPNTAWSSNGDGDKAWIEIELGQSYELKAIGFWTRTMGNSAQIASFIVIADGTQKLGPFSLPDASTTYYFDLQARAKRLRFEVESSSGGNTGAVEIEAYSEQ